MTLYTKIINTVCTFIATRLFRKRTYVAFTNGTKYLQRTYLISSKNIFGLPEILLHQFFESDQDPDLHNHPWDKSVSYILTGSYRETRLFIDNKTKFDTDRIAPTRNIIYANDYHQITLLEKPIWTLFIAGKRIQSWGFWKIELMSHIPSKEYIISNNNHYEDLDGNITTLPE